MTRQTISERIHLSEAFLLPAGTVISGEGGGTASAAYRPAIGIQIIDDGSNSPHYFKIGEIPREGIKINAPKVVDSLPLYKPNAAKTGYEKKQTLEITTDHSAELNFDSMTELLTGLVFGTAAGAQTPTTPAETTIATKDTRATGWVYIRQYDQTGSLIRELWWWSEIYVNGGVDLAGNKWVLPKLAVEVLGSTLNKVKDVP
jgi:hypothetical protein